MPEQRRNPRQIDIVVPALNESATIARLIEALFAVETELPCRIELIVVDDGSTDDTANIVEALEDRYPIRLIRLTRNFGKETALLAGLDQSDADAAIIMDADLQHPVALIAEFVDRWRDGYDCVYAVRTDRNEESALKRLLARSFYFLVNRGAEVSIPRDALDFRLLDRKAVQALRSLRERVRFTKGLYAWLGFRSIAVPVTPAPRADGSSHFNMQALMRLAWDGMTSFSDWPLRLAGSVGSVIALLSVAYAFFIAVRTVIFGIDVPGWATLTVVLCFLGGLQLLFLGIIGQYVRAVFIESKQRPSYLVSSKTRSPLCVNRSRLEALRPEREEHAVS